MMTKLIIIRGPSGSGKSTVADEIMRISTRPIMNVSEDTFRKMFSDHTKVGHAPHNELAVGAVIHGLQNGYDVIYHGILNTQNNPDRFDEILKIHPTENYFFYLDVSFDETVRRHETRFKKNDFGVESMKKWWDSSSPTYRNDEVLIAETSSLSETINTVDNVAKLEINIQ